MAERTSYESGAFSWIDLATTDQDGAKAFYAGLFGWECEDTPVGGGATYTMCRLDGKDVGAITTQAEQEREQGIPPHWNSYITAHDLDERTARVPELKGNLIIPPFDVLEVGRMALAADPTGGVFAMWQPKTHIGAGLVNAPGALSWNELATSDVEAAKDFYAELFGWANEDIDMNGAGTYTIVRTGDRSNGGIRALTPQEQGRPAFWLVYFGTVSCDEGAALAEKLGGRVVVPTMRVPAGGFTVIADPQGAAFALFEGDFDD
jgi:predicted enzyme related to lactoylglutathione lyase